MGSKKGTSTTVVQVVPDYLESKVKNYINRAKNLFLDHDTESEYYTGNTYAAQPTEETDALTGLAARGNNGDALIQTYGEPLLEDILNGDHLAGNNTGFITALEKVLDKATTTFENDIWAKLGGKLYFVGDLSGDNLAQESSEITKYKKRMEAFLYSTNYHNERERRNNALQLGIEYGKQDVIDAETLRFAGLKQREHDHGLLINEYALWVEKQVNRVKWLDVYGNAIRSLVGSEQSTTEPYYRPSPIIGMLGGAMSGAAMGTMIAPGIGTGIGAAAGAIMGLLSGG